MTMPTEFLLQANKNADGIQYLTNDHNWLRFQFDLYLRGNQSFEDKMKLVQKFSSEIVLHTAVEEKFLYPLITEKLGEEQGNMLFQKNVLDNMISKEIIRFLELTVPKNDYDRDIYDKLVQKFISIELDHMKAEEEDVFPIVKNSLNAEELATLEDLLKWAKDHGPSAVPPTKSPTETGTERNQ